MAGEGDSAQLVIRRADRGDLRASARLFRGSPDEFFPAAAAAAVSGGGGGEDGGGEREKELEELLEQLVLFKSLLSVVVELDGETVAFASFDTSPMNGGFNSAEACVGTLNVAGASVSNTLFITSWACDATYGAECLDLVMKTLFLTMPEYDFVVLMCHPQSPSKSLYSDLYFDIVGSGLGQESKDGVEWDVMCCERISFQPSLKARMAQVEDYDDLVQVFESQSQVLKDQYGEFFLAELIECQNAENRAVVGELGGKAVAMLCMTSEIDVNLLVSTYDLEAFDYLNPSSGGGGGGAGASENVFAITVFCIDQAHRTRTRDLLEAAFSCFPDREYCALTLPNDVYESSLLPYFCAVPTKSTSGISHSLFLIHRDSLRGIRKHPITESGKRSGDVPDWVGGSQLSLSTVDAEDDLQPILDLVQGLDTEETISSEIKASVEQGNSDLHTLVVRVLDQPIGVLVLDVPDGKDHERQVEQLDHLFDLRSLSGLPPEGPAHCNLRHGTIHSFSLTAIFNQYARPLLKDTMRLLGLDVLYFKLYPQELPPNSILEEMMQVRPRQTQMLQRRHRTMHLDRPKPPNSRFALFALPKSALSEPRLVVHSRVVVVGSSESGLALLEELLLVQHMHLPKITLVAPGGIADERFDGVRQLCTEGTAAPGSFDSAFVDRLGLRQRVAVVEDRVSYLERDVRAVVLADGSLLEYDFLILATGLQDTTLSSACGLTMAEVQASKALCDSAYSVKANPRLAAGLRRAVLDRHTKRDSKAVVFGTTLEAYAAVEALLEWGRPGESITMVFPGSKPESADGSHPVFGEDIWAATCVENALQEAGVNMRYGMALTSIEYSRGYVSAAVFSKSEAALEAEAAAQATQQEAKEEGKQATGSDDEQEDAESEAHDDGKAESKSATGATAAPFSAAAAAEEEGKEIDPEVVLPCGILITAGTRDIDPDIFQSVNDTGLVYDGRMVVNTRFQTVDPRIFGSGPSVKFSRKYRVKHCLEAFNSREVGCAVAESLLEEIDPLRSASAPNGAFVPTFSLPRVVAHNVELPGRISYFCAVRPGWRSDAEQRPFKVLETTTEHNFCRLELDRLGHVASVSYGVRDSYFDDQVSKEVDEGQRASRLRTLKNRQPPLDQLVGLHVSYLNDAEQQLERGEISDLFEFLSRDWAAALYHDRFGDFCRELQGVLANNQDADLGQAVQELKKVYQSRSSEDLDIIVKRNEVVGAGGNMLKGLTKRTIQDNLVRFLNDHANILEMYYVGN
ncbi:Cilia- and flagella-associated protein 61 (CFAP61) (Flagellar-associated protein 61) [Durusdinium trenchii]|uniref:Cilia- and flagella-associated protein 61 (CFAP61) (Flagellar-associated protein 61) n=1 Tax=Durusdinium trenchii TaxID=1381693 RepID=A0ABP0SE25_9DINO